MKKSTKTLPLGVLEKSLGYWVYRLNRAMYAEFGERLAALGVSPPEWTALCQIEVGEATPVVVAERMGIDRAAVTRILDSLAKKKLVVRRRHALDGRLSVLALTEKARALLPKLVAASWETNGMFLESLTKKQSAVLMGLLRVVCEGAPSRVYPLREIELRKHAKA